MQQVLELTEVRNWQSSLRSRDAGALIHCIMCFMDKKKNILMLEKKNPHQFDYKPKLCHNAALPSNGIHLNIASTNCWTLCRAASSLGTVWVGNAYAKSFATWAILSISGYDDATCDLLPPPPPPPPHTHTHTHTQTFKAWSMIVVLITVYDILISSHPRHSSAPNWHALNYWLAYKMIDTYSIIMVL